MKYLSTSILLFAATLFAQDPAPGGRLPRGAGALTELKSYLALSDSQVTQLTDLRKQYQDAVAPVATQAADKRKTLVDLLKAGNADSNAISQLRQDLAGLRKQAQDTAQQYGVSARAVLTADQLTKLQALEDASKLMAAVHGAQALNLIEGQGPFGGVRAALGAGMMGRRAPR